MLLNVKPAEWRGSAMIIHMLQEDTAHGIRIGEKFCGWPPRNTADTLSSVTVKVLGKAATGSKATKGWRGMTVILRSHWICLTTCV